MYSKLIAAFPQHLYETCRCLISRLTMVTVTSTRTRDWLHIFVTYLKDLEKVKTGIHREAPFRNLLFPYGHCPKGGGGVKACQDGWITFPPTFAWGCKGLPGWFGALFFHVCPFDRRGGGLKNQHISKRSFPYLL